MAVLDLLLPPACASCGRFGAVVCRTCVEGFRPPTRDADRFLAPDSSTVVGGALVLALAAFAYEGALRRALQRLKYAGAARVAAPLARASLPTLARLLEISGAACLVPVPLHPQRERERGYNQAALLSRELGAACGIDARPLLIRQRATTRQHGLDRSARLHNLAGAFRSSGPGRPPSTVIVVDDILTTSATLEACAAVLREAGCHEVYGLAVAREV